jgi:hypothetical protein
MEDFKNKHRSINHIIQLIIFKYGNIFLIPNFWDGDKCAIGLIIDDKLIYISTWEYRLESNKNMKYYIEVELIDSKYNTIQNLVQLEGLNQKDLIDIINSFLISSN